MIERRRTYFGFELETEIDTIEGDIPVELRPAARDVLARELLDVLQTAAGRTASRSVEPSGRGETSCHRTPAAAHDIATEQG
jgi:hypothetical protein